MMRDPRRRSPEGSRRRKRDRRSSRDRQDPQQNSRSYTNTYPSDSNTSYRNDYRNDYRSEHRSDYRPDQRQDVRGNDRNDVRSAQYHDRQTDLRNGDQRMYQQTSQRSRAVSNSGSSSSSNSSVLDISRTYSTKRFGGVISTFFRAPSERSRRRRRRSGTKSRGIVFLNNSSSSSVNSDMAYGNGYIRRVKSRNFGSRNGASSSRYQNQRGVATGYDSSRPAGPKRDKTDEEILEIGRQLSDMARQQNKEDMRAAGRSKTSGLVAAASAISAYRMGRKDKKDKRDRGIGSSKPHGSSSSDDSDWESASDDDDDYSSDDANSHLAYGSSVSHNHVPASAVAGAGIAAGAASATYAATSHLPSFDRRKSSVVDPQLFGPVNSLRGMINTPCGFDDTGITSAAQYRSHYGPNQRYDSLPTSSSAAMAPMREVQPLPIYESGRSDANANYDPTTRRELPRRSQTDPVPLQQPIPKTPVSSKVYDAEKLEDASRRDSRSSRQRSDDKYSGASAAAAGVAAAAVGAALASGSRKGDQRDERREERREKKEKQREGEDREYRDKRKDRDREYDGRSEKSDKRDRDSNRKDRDSERDKERRTSKRDSYSSKYPDERDHKRSSRQEDETPRKRRETAVDHYPDQESRKGDRSDRGDRSVVGIEPDSRSEISRSSRRDSKKSGRDERRELPGSEKVSNDAFVTPPQGTPKRPLTPNVVTVDREPKFDDNDGAPARFVPSDSRLSRKDSFEMERREQGTGARGKDPRYGHEYEEGEHEARSIYDEAKHFTAPIAAAAVASAIAVEEERSRERRHDRYSEDGSRDGSRKSKDAVLEEADRYYRESEIARKIASDEVRSRSRTPERSVLNKYDDDGADQAYTIVTPPEMEGKRHDETRFDGPNADVRIDNQIFPNEIHRFRDLGNAGERSFISRDPSAERDRPMLNLVFPTPAPSRRATPSPEDQKEKKKGKKKSSRGIDESSKKESVSDVVIGAKGEIMQPNDSPKSVTWGENSTKNFEIDTSGSGSKSEAEKPPHSQDKSTDKSRSKGNKSNNQWGILAAAIAGSTAAAATGELDSKPSRSGKKSKSDRELPPNLDRGEVEAPPVPGPKPPSPNTSHMPGGFADDIEFAATLAAGLKDTGFDPNIVIDDPAYRRRDSPPGSNEPNGDGWSHKSVADVVADVTGHGSSQDANRGMTEDGGEFPVKLSKKEKKRREKAKRQSIEVTESAPAEPEDTASKEIIVEEAPEPKLSKKEQRKQDKEAKSQSWADEVADEVADTPFTPLPDLTQASQVEEDVWQESGSKKSKKNRKSRDMQEDVASSVSVTTNAFTAEPEQIETRDIAEDVAQEPGSKKSKKKKKKSKGEEIDSPSTLSAPADSFTTEREPINTRDVVEDVWEESGSKKSKKKKNRDIGNDSPSRSSTFNESFTADSESVVRDDDDAQLDSASKKAKKKKSKKNRDQEDSPIQVSVPTDAFDDLASLRKADDYEEPETPTRSKRKSKRDSLVEDALLRSAAASEVSVNGKRSSKSKRRSGTESDFKEHNDDPPDREDDFFIDREVSSVVSDSRYDEKKRERQDSRSSKRRSKYDDDDAKSIKSVVSAPGGPTKGKDSGKRSSGIFSSIFKSGSSNKDDEKKESFLDNAGTLGAGAGLASIAALAMADVSRSDAADVSSDKEHNSLKHSDKPRGFEDFDPEIVPRAIKPAIDPQYGDLLPLPPSEPGTPTEAPEDFPLLPESRPDTPPEERNNAMRERYTHQRRKSAHETPIKSPSNTAIPVSLRLGQRGGTPTTPNTLKSPPLSSGGPTTPDTVTRRQGRHTSWNSSREIKPLYLLEHSRQGSTETVPMAMDLPELPPSEPSAPPSEVADFNGEERDFGFDNNDLAATGLYIETGFPSASLDKDFAGSQETTPKAEIKPEFPAVPPSDDIEAVDLNDPHPIEPMSKDRSSYLLNSAPSSGKSNKTADNVSTTDSPNRSTPTKRRVEDDGLALPDIAEDLTSADEHFSDAVDAQSEDQFEEARDWPEDEFKVEGDVVPAVVTTTAEEPPLEDTEVQRDLAPSTISTAVDDEWPPEDEWHTLSAKDKKKAKKAKKKKAEEAAAAALVAASIPAVAAAAAIAATEIEPALEAPKSVEVHVDADKELAAEPASEFEAQPEVTTANEPDSEPPVQPEETSDVVTAAAEEWPPEEEWQTLSAKDRKKAKKAKKKKEADEVAAKLESVPEKSKTFEEVVDAAREVAADSTAQLAHEPAPEPTSEPPSEPPPRSETVPAAVVDEWPPEEEWHTLSSKDRKKAKKAKQNREAEEAAATAAAAAAAEPEPVSEEPKTVTEDADLSKELSNEPAFEEPKKGKKAKRKSALQNDSPFAESSAEAAPETTAPVVEDTQDPVGNEEPANEDVPSSEQEVSMDPATRDFVEETPAEIDAWELPTKKDKKGKKKKKQKSLDLAALGDVPTPVEPDTSQDVAKELEPKETEPKDAEPKEIQLEEQPIDAAAATVEQATEETASKANLGEDSTIVSKDLTDEWATPATSKKDKKKKKKKGSLTEEPAPLLHEDTPLVDESPAAKSADPEPTIETATSADASLNTFETQPTASEPQEAAEDDFAPVTGGKKKKKAKRKSVQWAPDDELQVSQTINQDESPSFDVTPFAAEKEAAAETSVEHDEATKDEAEATKEIAEPSETTTQEGETTSSWLSGAAAFTAAGSIWKKAWGRGKADEIPVAVDAAPGPTETKAQDVQESIVTEDETLPSEPLFSQEGDAATTQDTSTTVQPSQDDDEWATPTTKKKGKKNKKRQSMSLDNVDEPTIAPATEPIQDVSVKLTDEAAVDQPSEEATTSAPESTPEEAANSAQESTRALEISPSTEPAPIEPEDEWGAVTSDKQSKKSKKKKKGSKSSISDAKATEPMTTPSDPNVFTAEPESIENVESSETIIPEDVTAPIETTQFESSRGGDDILAIDELGRANQDDVTADDWSGVTGKKSKKKKKRQSLSSQAGLEEAPVLEPVSDGPVNMDPITDDQDTEQSDKPVEAIAGVSALEETQQTEKPVDIVVDDSVSKDLDNMDGWAEPISKKGKKKKKRQSLLTEQEEPSNTPPAEVSNEPREPREVETSHAFEVTPNEVQKPADPEAVQDETWQQEPAQETPRITEEWPEVTSKKNKKKKKRQSLLADAEPEQQQDVLETSVAEKGAEATVEPAAETPTESPAPVHESLSEPGSAPESISGSGAKPAEQVQETAPTADPEAEFELPKKGKKSKTKKKGVSVDLTSAPENLDVSFDANDVVNASQQTSKSPTALEGEAAVASEHFDQDKAVASEDKTAQETPAPDVSSTGIDDNEFQVPVKLSKKDKKKKKKQAALEESFDFGAQPESGTGETDTANIDKEDPAMIPTTTTADNQPEQSDAIVGPDISTLGEAQSGDTEPQVEEAWGGFSLKTSKKDKKKKKKAKEVDSESPQEPPTATPTTEPVPFDQEGKLSQAEDPTPADISTEPSVPNTFELGLEKELEESQENAETGGNQIGTEIKDADDSWSWGLSKKEKKKLKKQKGQSTEVEVTEEPEVSKETISYKDQDVMEDADIMKQGIHDISSYVTEDAAASTDVDKDQLSGGDKRQLNDPIAIKEPNVNEQVHEMSLDQSSAADLVKSETAAITASQDLSSDVVAVAQSSSPKDPDADEEWSIPVTVKKGKKGKKNRRSQAEALSVDNTIGQNVNHDVDQADKNEDQAPDNQDFEPNQIPEPEADAVRELEVENATVPDVVDAQEVTGDTSPEYPDNAEGSAADEHQADNETKTIDETPILERKLSKKEKKERKKKAPFEEDSPDFTREISRDGDAAAMNVGSDDKEHSAVSEEPTEMTYPSVETTQEPDDSSFSKLSKKDKKKAKKLSKDAAALALAAVVGGELSTQSKTEAEIDAVESKEKPTEPFEHSDWADRVDESLPAQPASPVEAEAPVQQPEPFEEEAEWAVPVKKKGKKGKKGKDAVVETQAIDNTAAELEPANEDTVISKDIYGPASPEPETETGMSEERALPSEEVAAAAPVETGADDTWDLPIKKKSKKGKKTRSSTAETADFASTDKPDDKPEGQPGKAIEEASRPENDRALDTEKPEFSKPVEDDFEWSAPKKKKGKGKKSKLADAANTEQTSTLPEDIVENTILAMNDNNTPDASLDIPATSLGKNDVNMEDTSRDIVADDDFKAPSPVIDNLQSFTALDTTPVAPVEVNIEEAWEVPVSKKKSKKGKKSKSLLADASESTAHDALLGDVPADVDTREAVEEQKPEEDWFFSEPKSKKKKSKNVSKSAAVFEEEGAMRPERIQLEKSDDVSDESLKGEMADEERGDGIESQNRKYDDLLVHDKRKDADWSHAEDPFSNVEHNKPEEISTFETAATAGALSSGVALLAEKFGGGKKKKKKGKQREVVDKRQPKEDDIFDDPALWESADKKSVGVEGDDATNDDFWGGNDKDSTAKMLDAKDALPTPASGSFTESDDGWKETARQGARLDDEFGESPVLGRGEGVMMRSGPVGLLRRGSEVEDPVGGLLSEDRELPAVPWSAGSDISEFRRSPTRTLPAVEEVPETEAEETEHHGHHSRALPAADRDSGYVDEAVKSIRRRSRVQDEDLQRDSGVHTDDWDRGAPSPLHGETRLRGSPFGTPVLREPSGGHATPDPEKKTPRHSGVERDFGYDHERDTNRERDHGYSYETQDHAHKMKPGDHGPTSSTAAAATAALGRRSSPSPSPRPRSAQSQVQTQHRSVSEGQQRQQTGQHQGASFHERAASPMMAGGGDGGGATRRSVSGGAVAGASVAGAAGVAGVAGAVAGRRAVSGPSLSRQHTPEPLRLRPESPGITRSASQTPTPPPLRRVDKRVSGDLRALRQQNNSTPVANEGRARVKDKDKDMADIYDGFGEGRVGSPRSPTRPHSMRRRQSMQVLELESKVEQLLAENRLLTDARSHAEQQLNNRAANVLSERDTEIETLKQSLQFLRKEVARLTEVNDGLTSANAELAQKDSGRYAHLDASRGLDDSQGSTPGSPAFQQSLQEKDAEIADLRAQLESAKEQIRDMQRQILESKAGDTEFLNVQDEDHFDSRCQQLCSHVQQWVLRFSKFSDMRACRLTSEINDEKTIDRLDNAVLDGSDVDTYLRDRVRRRDIFMSMTMNMIWEFVFTRYLFGMDREQRQKLKSLEKLLTEVGPPRAVRQWRAVTLTLLAQRDSFKQQRDQDTEAVVQAVFQTLCKILPPPGNLENQIQAQLRRVMQEAVSLSVEMRTQRAEYMMLPPLQPEYDAEGELTATVQFNASMMNERSGNNASNNEELEAQGSVVRVVLFPLVVKRGDDEGVGDEEIVVCPAQVLVVGDRSRRHVTPSSDAGGASLGAPSRLSVMELPGQSEM